MAIERLLELSDEELDGPFHAPQSVRSTIRALPPPPSIEPRGSHFLYVGNDVEVEVSYAYLDDALDVAIPAPPRLPAVPEA